MEPWRIESLERQQQQRKIIHYQHKTLAKHTTIVQMVMCMCYTCFKFSMSKFSCSLYTLPEGGNNCLRCKLLSFFFLVNEQNRQFQTKLQTHPHIPFFISFFDKTSKHWTSKLICASVCEVVFGIVVGANQRPAALNLFYESQQCSILMFLIIFATTGVVAIRLPLHR